ncbi:MAG: hypothetical protein ACRC14_03745 [Paracoccaceae bacterium]
MARRKLASITGVDPEYTRKFQATRPASVTAVDVVTVPSDPTVQNENATPEVTNQEGAPPLTVAPEPGQQAETDDSAETKKRRIAGKRGRQSRAEALDVVKDPVSLTKRSARTPDDKSLVDVRLSALERHRVPLERLAAAGFPSKDVMIFAGKRLLAGIALRPVYVQPANAVRITAAPYVYRSTKAIDDKLIATIARKHDPLGVRGKYAMVQGQFEQAFWDELDRVIKELADR